MKRSHIIIISIAAVLYVVFHFATLIYSPFPWFDEVCYLSIAESYLKTHHFYESLRPLGMPDEKLLYGPVYFVMQAWVIKLFGLSIFNFRVTGLLFGLADLFLIGKICKKLGFTAYATLFTIVLVAIEPNFNQFLHAGRMDFVTLVFFLGSYLVFSAIAPKPGLKFVVLSLLTGALLGCAILTTPRIVFAFSFYICFFVYEMLVQKDNNKKLAFVKYLLAALTFIILYMLWIYHAYGSIQGYISFNKNSSTMQEHVGIGSGAKMSIRYNLLIFAYSIFAFALMLRNKMLAGNLRLALLCFPPVIAFILIVTGGISGRYFALVTPFTSLLIVGVTINLGTTKILRGITYGICAVFAGIFIFKGIYIVATMPQHDPIANGKAISQYLTKNSSVCADFEYYYLARDNDCSFFSLEKNGPLNERVKYALDKKIRYFIISKANPSREIYENALLNQRYKRVAVIDDKRPSAAFLGIVRKFPYLITDSYACYIYEYKD